jgi:lipopolysaccharide export system protein LptA
MHRTAFKGAALAGLFVVVVLTAPAWSQPPPPLVVDADRISFDQLTQFVEAEGNVRLRYRGIRLSANFVRFNLRDEQLVAEGRVVLVDADGRELRGARIRYDVRLQLAEVEQAQGIVKNVYVRAARLQAQPQRVEAQDALVTTCDPAQPGYRITATHVELIPGEQLVAQQATLWIGRFRILTLPTLTISLRTSEETARSFPRFGYNHVDGLWGDYPYSYTAGPLDGLLYGKYGTLTGFIARNTLAYEQPSYSVSLTVGRNQNEDQLVFDQAEAVVATPALRLGSLPFFYGIAVRSGWFREPSTGVETSRSRYELRLETAQIPLGARTSLAGNLRLEHAHYGTGARYGVGRADLTAAYRLNAEALLSFRYRLLDTVGATPFLFDAVLDADKEHTVGLQYTRTYPRTPALTATYGAGVSYNFRDRTPSVNAGFGQRVPEAYHWNLGAEYNLTTRAVKLSTDSGIAIGQGTYVTVQAWYFPQTGQFEDLDLFVTSRLCGCFDLTLKYRHIRGEFWLEFGLSPDARVQFPPENE